MRLTDIISESELRDIMDPGDLLENYADLKAAVEMWLWKRRAQGNLSFDIGALVQRFGGDREGMASLLAELPGIVKDVDDGYVQLKATGYDDAEPDMPPMPPPDPGADAEDDAADAGELPPETEPAPDDNAPVQRPADTVGRTATASNPLVP